MHIKTLNHPLPSFWIAITVIVLAYFCGTITLTRPLMLPGLALAVMLSALFVKKPAWALGILICLTINVYAIVPGSYFPSIRLPGLGGLFPQDILLLLFVGIMSFKVLVGRNESLRSSISYPIIALIILSIMEAIRSFLEGGNPHFIVNQMRPVAFYLFYFLILASLRRENDLICFLKLLLAISIISTGTIYFQAITGRSLGCPVAYDVFYGFHRPFTLGEYLIPCAILLLFSLVVGGKKETKFFTGVTLLIIWMGIAIILTLIRSAWVSILLSAGVIILLNSRQTNRIIIVLFLMSFLFIMAAPVVKHITGSKSMSYVISDRFSTAYRDVSDLNGSFMTRTQAWKIRWDYMINNNPIFGQGFRGRVSQGFNINDRYDPTNTGFVATHNIIGFLAVRYGLSGFFVFGWLLFAVFRQAIRLLRTLPPSWQKSLVCGLLAFNIQTIFASYATNAFFRNEGILTIVSSWAVLELIERFHKQKQNRNLTAAHA